MAQTTDQKEDNVNRNVKFNYRGFTSVFIAISFIMLTLTGFVLFVAPPGRIANWTGWNVWGLTKHQWSDVHIWFGTVFIIASVFHIIFNWRYLVNYFRNKTRRTLAVKREWIAALGISVIIIVGSVVQFPPFSKLMDLNSKIKYSWDDPRQAAPVAHAELLTFDELAKKVRGIDLEKIKSNLAAKDIELKSSGTTIGQLAQAHNMTAAKLYDIAVAGSAAGISRKDSGSGQGRGRGRREHLAGTENEDSCDSCSGGDCATCDENAQQKPSGNTSQQNQQKQTEIHRQGTGSEHNSAGTGNRGTNKGRGGFGIGRMTLRNFCTANDITVRAALKKLRQKAPNISVTADTTMRDIATSLNIHPSQMKDILLK